MNALDLVAANLAKPMTHVVTTTYANGTIKRHETRSAAQAENWAVGERRKLGRDLINRATGEAVRISSVDISPL